MKGCWRSGRNKEVRMERREREKGVKVESEGERIGFLVICTLAAYAPGLHLLLHSLPRKLEKSIHPQSECIPTRTGSLKIHSETKKTSAAITFHHH